MKIDLNKLQEAIEFIDYVNSIPTKEIIWVRDDVIQQPTSQELEDWLYVGLGNVTFAELYMLYKNNT